MEAFTQNNPTVCLQQDDLEAIHTIYPDCSLSVGTPVCYRVHLNLGLVRMAAYVLIPLLIVLGLVILAQAILQHHNREELQEHKDELKLKRKEAVKHRFQMGIVALKAAKQAGKSAETKPAGSRKFSLSRMLSGKNHVASTNVSTSVVMNQHNSRRASRDVPRNGADEMEFTDKFLVETV